MSVTHQRLLVIGGTGFIGSSFANWSQRQGHRVWACSRQVSVVRRIDAGVELLRVDATDLSSLRHAFKVSQPTSVLFAVAQIVPRSEGQARCSTLTAELRAIVNTLECMGESDCAKLIYLSSAGAIYGGGESVFSENGLCNPRSYYGKAKLHIEELIGMLAPRIGVRFSILRLSNPFGPGQDPFGNQGAISIFMNRILSGETVQVFGNPDAHKDYIYIDDVNRAIEKSLWHREDSVFNVGAGASIKLSDLICLIEKECGREARKVFMPLCAGEVESFSVDIRRAEEMLQWRPTTSIEDGIHRTMAWMECFLAARGAGPGTQAESL